MAIEQLTLVNIDGPIREINRVLIKCCESGYFHINPPPDTSGVPLVAKSLRDKGVYDRMIKRCRSIADALGVKLDPAAPYDTVEYSVSIDFKRYLDEVDEKYSGLFEEHVALDEQLRSHVAIFNNLIRLSDFNASFEELFACKYIKVRFGRMPSDNIRKLEFYEDEPFVFFPFESDQNYTWCLYLAPREQRTATDYLFNSLEFQRVKLPDYLNGNADQSKERLIEVMTEETRKIEEIERGIAEIAAKEGEKLSRVYAKLISINNGYALRNNALVAGNRFFCSGYIPSDRAEEFKRLMPEGVSITTGSVKHDKDAPVRLKNNRLFRPFEMFVTMYGLPAPGGIDPTPFVAITYMLLYGIMFADLGQGLLIFLLGLILTRFTKIKLAPIMTRIGLSSAVFGLLYGSVFGSEEIIKPFFQYPKIYTLLGYESPPSDLFGIAAVLLIGALLIGIALVLISMIVNMIVCIKTRDVENGIFGASGLLGFIFYGALILGLGGSFIGLELMKPWYIVAFIVVPLVFMFFKEPFLRAMKADKKPAESGDNRGKELLIKLEALFGKADGAEKTSVGTFIIEGVIELFETCLTYLTNTMSFLRIGGFILSHAGLMLVFRVLADMFGGGVGTIIVGVVGNLFVTGFEGLIVGIQVLRLEFYELFSRYFRAGGKPFNPIRNTTV
ncbi:MAG: hypothetical protein NC084_07815 [Bacteroides sp.]|nr:hypothetical protein [Eubacterium sp.]MCM1418516.1 hypothetical protein [Roseburia sp.]MCM1462603.1 hypothetical protein [Bacteroides sp.]